MVCYADIAINIPRDNLFTYLVEDERLLSQLEVGKRVLVPFRGRQLSGYLVGWHHEPGVDEEKHRLLPIGDIVDEQPLFRRWSWNFIAGQRFITILLWGLPCMPCCLADWPIAHAGNTV